MNTRSFSESSLSSLPISSRTGQSYLHGKTQQSMCLGNFAAAIVHQSYDQVHPVPTYQLGSLLSTQRKGVVSLVPLPVWKAVNKDDAVLHQGLGSDQLVVGGIVDHINDSGLSCAA